LDSTHPRCPETWGPWSAGKYLAKRLGKTAQVMMRVRQGGRLRSAGCGVVSIVVAEKKQMRKRRKVREGIGSLTAEALVL
jgi:hypothetical protein